jgi:uncharacterized protein YgiM (DUF1202 family)
VPNVPGLPSIPGLPGGGGDVIPGNIPGLGTLPGADDAAKAAIRAAVADLLANGQDPDKMEQVATAIEPYGFTAEAAALRARAAVLRAQKNLPNIPVTPPPSLTPQYAVVKTNDPPPSGDLIIRSGPSDSAGQIGGAGKNTTVTVLTWNADGNNLWSKVVGAGAQQWPGGAGYVKQKYLKPSAAAPTTPAPPTVPVIPNVPNAPTPPTSLVAQGIVTTNDPAPSGDLIIRSGPSNSASQIGGAGKNTKVTILDWNASADGVWAKITGAGALQWPGATGYAKKAYIKLVSTTVSGIAVGAVVSGNNRTARVASSGGLKLRAGAGPQSRILALIPANAMLTVEKIAKGAKADHRSPGPGGWACVNYQGQRGWVPAEWLVLS